MKKMTAQRLAEALTEEKAARDAYESASADFEDASLHDVKLDESIRRMAELRAKENKASRDGEKKAATKDHGVDVEESLRRMEELRAKEQQLSDERIRRSREEIEAEKHREEEEAKRVEAKKALERIHYEEERKKVIEEARKRERERCRQRDQNMCGLWRGWWSSEKALKRFKLVSEEFDKVTFNDARPLTFISVPWPLLSDPLRWKVADIEWSGIEQFFKEVRTMLLREEYKTLVEQCHRRFHPDKWKARRILTTASDDEKRELEAAGNVVAQALTPLWLATRV